MGFGFCLFFYKLMRAFISSFIYFPAAGEINTSRPRSPHANQCKRNGSAFCYRHSSVGRRAGWDAIAFYYTSGRLYLFDFLLNHSAAKKPQMNADKRRWNGETCGAYLWSRKRGHDSISINNISIFYFFFYIFPSGRGNNIPHPRPPHANQYKRNGGAFCHRHNNVRRTVGGMCDCDYVRSARA